MALTRAFLSAGGTRLVLPVNPYSAMWSYDHNTTSTDTLGGRVIQLLSVQVTDVNVSTVAGGRRELQRMADGVREIMNYHIQTSLPAKFVVPSRAWSFSVFIRAMPQIGWDVAATTYPYQLTMAIVEDLTGVKTKQIERAALARLADGIGYNPAVHGGSSAAFTELVDTVLKMAPQVVGIGAGGGAGGTSGGGGAKGTPGKWGGNDLWQPDVSNAPWSGNKLQDQIFNAWAAVFGSKTGHDALCIAQRESGFTPAAKNHNTNGSWDYGLFQMNTIHHTQPWWPQDADLNGHGGLMFDPEYNTRCAMQLFKQAGGSSGGGFGPWVTAPQCGL